MEPTTPPSNKLRDILFKTLNTALPVLVTGILAMLQDPNEAEDLWWSPFAVIAINAAWAAVRQWLGNYVPPPAEALKPRHDIPTDA